MYHATLHYLFVSSLLNGLTPLESFAEEVEPPATKHSSPCGASEKEAEGSFDKLSSKPNTLYPFYLYPIAFGLEA